MTYQNEPREGRAQDFPSRFERLVRTVHFGQKFEGWEAYDTWRQAPVKVLRALTTDETSTQRLMRMFRLFALSDSPHLATSLDWGYLDDGTPWVSLGWVDHLPRPAAPASAETLMTWAIAGARALHEGHCHGLVHSFISPEAFFLSPEGQVVLGFWGFNVQQGDTEGSITGVMPYMAPEAFSGPAQPASDLYSLGAVLYDMATGAQPHAGLSGGDMARARLASSLPALETLRPDLPLALVRSIDRLIAPNPADRFENGLALLAALNAPLLPSLNPPPVSLDAPLDRLLRAYESFRKGNGGAMVVTGQAGAGKSTVLRAFKAEVALRGGQVIERSPIDGLDRVSALEAEISGAQPNDGSLDLDPAMPAAARTLLKRAAMLSRLASSSRQQQLVLAFDDLGIQEEETIAQLERLLASHGSHVMVVVTVRGEEASAGKVLARLKRNPLVRELPLPPISEQACATLAATCLGPGVLAFAPITEAIAASNGNPFILLETLRALVAEGCLVLGPSGWTLGKPTCQLPLAASLDAALSARLEALSPLGKRLAAVAAVIQDVEATRPLLAGALDEPLTPELDLELQTLVAQRWLVRERGGYRLAHALLRPVLARVLSAPEQCRVHACLAELMTAQQAPETVIARHLAAAGQQEAAAAMYEQAAQAAAERNMSLLAFQYRQQAYRQSPNDERRQQLADQLGLSCISLDPHFALDLLAPQLADGSLPPLERARLVRRVATSHMYLGHYRQAHSLLASALEEVPAEAPWQHGVLKAYYAFTLFHQGRQGIGRNTAQAAIEDLDNIESEALPAEIKRVIGFGRMLAEFVLVSSRRFIGVPVDRQQLQALQHAMEGALGLPELACWPWLITALPLAYEGRLAEAQEALATGRTMIDDERDAPSKHSMALTIEAMLATRAGDLDQAVRSAAAGVAYTRTHMPTPYYLGLALCAQAEALLAIGQRTAAEAAAAEAVALQAEPNYHIGHMAKLLLAEALAGRSPAESLLHLETVLADVQSPDVFNRQFQARAWRLVGECRQALGQREEAFVALSRAAEEAGTHRWPYLHVQALLALAHHHKANQQFGRMQRVAMRASHTAKSRGYNELARLSQRLCRRGLSSGAALSELRRLLGHQGALDELVSQGLSLATGLALADRAAFYLKEGDQLRLASASPASLDTPPAPPELLAETLQTGRTCQYTGVMPAAGFDIWLIDADVRSMLAIPLGSSENPLGVLFMDRRSVQGPFSAGEVAQLEILAADLALALSQALRAGPTSGRSDGRNTLLETTLAQQLEAERRKRGLLSTLSADLRAQLTEVQALIAIGHDAPDQAMLGEALAHAERLAAQLEKSLRG